ncbi:MAG: DASS family sodium-coupled anion symporter [Acidobacteria bacterium]|nr:DASS family sodium-coupled anion symporter [Acidobacteriota bacterium]
MSTITRRGVSIGVTIVAAVAAYWLVRPVVPELAARATGILVLAAGFWATEALPLFATAFVVIGLEIVLLAEVGGLAEQLTSLLVFLGVAVNGGSGGEEIDAAQFLAPFAQDIVILFLAGFFLSAAMAKHGVDRVLAARLLRPLAASPRRLIYGLLGLSAVFSMWMSNTATAAMMLSLLNPLIADRPRGDRLSQSMILAVAFGANIGGLGTPIGTPPNAIAFGALNAAGYTVTFLSWMLVAVPLAAVLLVVCGLLLPRLLRPPDGGAMAFGIPEARQPLSWHGYATLAVLAVAMCLWITSGIHGVRPGAVGLLAVAALTALGSLDQRDVNAIDWSILILMWGGLSLSIAVDASGLAGVLANADVSALTGGLWLAALVTVLTAVTLSTVMSNTAAAALLVPMALALSLPSGEQLAMLAALGCSLAMALPVSTPPNAVAYATGRVELATMRRVGGLVSVICVVILLLGYRLMLPLIF